MERKRRNQLMAGALGLVAAVVVYRAWAGPSSAAPPSSNVRPVVMTQSRTTPPGAIVVPDVHLEALDAAHPEPGERDRNLFRFRPKAPPPPPPSTKPAPRPVPVTGPSAPVQTGPPPPPPVPPITLKFIGIVEAPDSGQKIAILSDGKVVMQGREGEIVEGRYKILRIGTESIEMAYVDGRGRQTIRLTGG